MFRLTPSRQSLAALAVAAGLLAAFPAIAKDKDPFTHFGELTKDAEHKSGFLDIYQKRENIYLEIPVERLGEPMLMIQSLSKGIGTHGFLGGMPTHIFDGLMVQFERKGDRVQLIQINSRFRAPEGSPEAAAVDLSFSNSVLASLKIESERHEGDEIGKPPEKPKEKEDKNKKDDEKAEKDEEKDDEEEEKEESKKPVTSVVIDFGKILFSDLPNMTQALNDGDGLIVEKTGGSYHLDDDRSSLNSIKVFPKNAEFDVDLVFTSGKDPFIETVIDSRYVTLGLHSSFSELPKEPMRPRHADPRVGFFTTEFKDFSLNHENEFFVRYVNRWRLEKENPGAAMSKPKKQIVYYVENTVPKEYRKYIKEGIEMWQKAYEAAGFKDAIVAKDQPDDPDWSAEDVRYSSIRWITSHNASFGAIGPSRTDPRTGEILDADILVEANMFQGFRKNWQRIVAPRKTGIGVDASEDPFAWAIEADRLAWENAMASGGPDAARRSCAAAEGLSMSAGFANIAMMARGDIAPGDEVPEEFMGQAIRWVVAHEVGHTLGLEHNFRSSMSCPYSKLNDKAWVEANGLYGSVMEYPNVNFAKTTVQQGYYYSPVVGSYDDWAIRYGYSEFKGAKTPDDEKAQLEAIAGLSSDPLHTYGSGENSYPIGAVDPFINTWDLGDDPLAFARDRSSQVVALFDGLDRRLVKEGESWDNLTSGFSVLLGNYYQSMGYLARYVGGMETSRSVKGELNGSAPIRVIPAAKQREAVAFLAEHLFSDRSFNLSPDFMAKLSPYRWAHWGMPFMPGGREDFPFHSRILAMERPVLARLTHPITLQRLVDAELYEPDAFSIAELFETMDKAIWTEVLTPPAAGVTKISTIRRGGQRLWLDSLIDVAFTPASGTPDDARAMARMCLMDLQKKIDAALEKGATMDKLTKAHLADCRARVASAIDAGYQLEKMDSKKG